MPLPSKPTVKEIIELYDEVEKHYAETGIRGEFDLDEKFYELDLMNELLLPDEFKAEGIILPTGRDIVDTCVDHTDISNPRVWVNKKGTSKKSDEEAELLRKFGLGVLYRNNVEAPIAPLRVGAKHFWMHGVCFLKTVWDADRWAGRPDRKEGESESDYALRVDEWRATNRDSIPIVMRAVHPKNVMLDPFSDGGTFVFETREELCYNVKNRFKNWTNPKSKKITDKVEHISFWSRFYRCELYDREPVIGRGGGVVKHSYDFIPYTEIDTGLGNISSNGDVKKRYVGVLRYVQGLLISESRDYSIGDVILKRTAFPWGYLKGKGARNVQEISQKFGEYTPMPDDVEIVDVVPKMPPNELLTWIAASAQYLSSHAAPASVRGEGEQGVRSAADRRLVIAEASTRYHYSNEAFKHGVAKVLANCARIMKNVVPGSMNVWARTPTDEFDITINKDKMKEPFTFYVEFSPISEEDEYRRHDDLERLYKAGLVTKRWARKQMSNVDPLALEKEEEKENLKNDPALRQLVSQYLQGEMLKALTKLSRAESIEEPPEMMAPTMAGVPIGGGGAGTVGGGVGEPGRRMAPPSSEKPVPGSAEAIQNQLKGIRSQTSMTGQGRGGGGNRR